MGAIAYYEFLIDGRCGEARLLADIIKVAVECGKTADDAVIELDWVAIDTAILCN